MGKRFRQDWSGTFIRNGVRYLFCDVAPVQPFKPQYVKPVRKISLWQKVKTAISTWWERLYMKLRRRLWE